VKTFHHKGREFTIRVYETSLGWKAAIFQAGKRVSGYVPLHDLQVTQGCNAMRDYLEIIESEFKSGRSWMKYKS